MGQPGPKPFTDPPTAEQGVRANIGKRRPRDPTTGRYVVSGEKHLLRAETIEREAVAKGVDTAAQLKELTPDTIEFLERVMHTPHYKIPGYSAPIR